MDDGRPLFLQIAEMIENSIIDGSLGEEDRVPSTNELSAFHRINPATAGKGLNQLVADGIVYKKRGIGMFVTTGARDALRFRRRERFSEQFIRPLMAEADKLGLTGEELKKMIDTNDFDLASTQEWSPRNDPAQQEWSPRNDQTNQQEDAR